MCLFANTFLSRVYAGPYGLSIPLPTILGGRVLRHRKRQPDSEEHQQLHVGPPSKGRDAPKKGRNAPWESKNPCNKTKLVKIKTAVGSFTGRLSFKVVLGKARDLSAQVKGEVFRCRRPEHLAVTCLRATVPGASPFSGLYGPLSPGG